MKRANMTQKTGSAAKVDRQCGREAALAKIECIISDEREAKKFFFVEMFPAMSAIAASYSSSTTAEIEADEVCGIAYRECWEDDWKRLRAFKGDTTPHAWVSKIARQALQAQLAEERFIVSGPGSHSGDYRLTVRGIPNDMTRRAIVDMVREGKEHRALELYYVDKADTAALAKEFGGEDVALGILESAQKTLIEVLLTTDNPFADIALSSKKGSATEIALQEWHDRFDDDTCENVTDLRTVLSGLFGSDDWDTNADEFTKLVIDRLNWNQRDIIIWNERYFKGTPTAEVADELDVDPDWLNTRFHYLRNYFRRAVKAWWNDPMHRIPTPARRRA